MALYIPCFQVLWERLHFFLPSGLQVIIIFDIWIGSILSIFPYKMSCFRVISSNIVSCASIFHLKYTSQFLHYLNHTIPFSLYIRNNLYTRGVFSRCARCARCEAHIFQLMNCKKLGLEKLSCFSQNLLCELCCVRINPLTPNEL
jgi:hypothetical protein